MKLAVVNSRAQVGVSAPPVRVEVHLTGGLPRMAIVGLPETAVKESKDRVRSALLTSGFTFPNLRATYPPCKRPGGETTRAGDCGHCLGAR